MGDESLAIIEALAKESIGDHEGVYGMKRSYSGRRGRYWLHAPDGHFLSVVPASAAVEVANLCDLANAVPALCKALRQAREATRADDAPDGR